MKKILPALALMWGLSAWAADAAPLFFRAVLVMGPTRYFSLSTGGGARQQWVAVGDEFEGYQIARYDDTARTLVVAKDGREYPLLLATARIAEAPAKATLAQAEDVLRKMDFEHMMERVIEQQKQSIIGMVRQTFARQARPGVSADEMVAFQGRVMDALWAEMKPADLSKDVARVYTEVFTQDELRGLGEFYGTPTGQAMVAKQPELQQKMMQAIMPRMMSAMPKVQQMAQEFAAEHAAVAKEQAGGGTSPAPASPPPTDG